MDIKSVVRTRCFLEVVKHIAIRQNSEIGSPRNRTDALQVGCLEFPCTDGPSTDGGYTQKYGGLFFSDGVWIPPLKETPLSVCVHIVRVYVTVCVCVSRSAISNLS